MMSTTTQRRLHVTVLALIAFAALAMDASAQLKVLRFGRLIDEGRVIDDAVIVVSGDSILRIGNRQDAVPVDAEVIDLSRFTAIPGLIDVHTHMTYWWDRSPGTTPWRQGGARTVEQTVASAAENARLTLESGVTTVRDLGASNHADILLRDRIATGDIPGPRMFVSGYGLQKARGTQPPGATPATLRGRVTEPADIDAAVQAQVDAGADVIKVYGSTGSGADVTGRQTFSFEEMEAAVDAAHRLGRRIAIHSYGPEGARDAVRAGAESVEHAVDIDDITLAEMARRGTIYVPTIDHNRYYADHRDEYGYTAEQVAALDAFRARNMETARRAFLVGVRLGMGSDAVFTGFGQNTRELRWFVEIGMSPAEAIATATTNAAALLGMAHRLGRLAPGYQADIVALVGNPLEDIDVVIEGVRWVMKAGRVVVDRTH